MKSRAEQRPRKLVKEEGGAGRMEGKEERCHNVPKKTEFHRGGEIKSIYYHQERQTRKCWKVPIWLDVHEVTLDVLQVRECVWPWGAIAEG